MIALKPMQLGEIIDRSAAFWRGHWKKLYGLFFAFNVAQFALLRGFQAVQARVAPLSRGGAAAIESAKSDPGEFFRQMAIGMGGLMVVMGIIVFVALLETIAAARYTMPAFLGQSASVRESLARTWARFGASVGTFALAIGWSMLALVAFMVPGFALVIGSAALTGSAAGIVLAVLGAIAIGLGMLAWLLWFILRFSLWAQVLAMEDVGALAAFRRCDVLTSGRIGPGFLGLVKVRLTVLITVIGLLLFMITAITSAPSLILQGIYGNMFDPMHADPDAVPLALQVPAQLLSIVVNSAVYPLYIAALTLFYVDMRVRREGLDLELQLQAAPK